MSWDKVKLENVLKQYRFEHIVQDNHEYKQVTISKHDGVCFRGVKKGSEIGRKRQFIINLDKYPNTLMFVRQGVDDGAIGIAPIEVNGCIATENMPMFSIENINTEFLRYIIKSKYFQSEISKISTTGSAQKSIHERQLLQIEIPYPSIPEQQKIVAIMNRNDLVLKDLFEKQSHQLDLLKKLRQQLLQDAVQGKLVTQDPNDEPASKLVEGIKVEKEILVRGKKIKKEKPLPPIKPEEIPFEIPESWAWCRLGEIVKSTSTGPFGSMLHKSDYVNSGFPLVNPMNIINGKIVASAKMMIDYKTKVRLRSYELFENDIVIGRRGEMGRCAVISKKEEGWLCGTGCFFLRLPKGLYGEYFTHVLRSNYSSKYLLGSSVGETMNNLNHKILNSLPFPLPPLQEQYRIVNKFEKLLRICDELELSIQQNQKYTRELLQVALKEALEPDLT